MTKMKKSTKSTEEVKKEVKTTRDVYGRKKGSPVKPYRNIVVNTHEKYNNRVLVATPSTGTVRMEWVQARYGQVIPVNWSQVIMTQYLNSFIPIGFTVANAQNVIVKEVIDKEFEWLLLIEQDNLLPSDAFLRFNRYIKREEAPVVSGLYYTKNHPPEPLVFRGRGTGVFEDFKLGDRIWCDGVPTGCLLIHGGLLRAMWNESPEYETGGIRTRRVFDDPRRILRDDRTGNMAVLTGTSDLEWCTRVIEGKFLEKSGWSKYQKKKYPFLVDTNIFTRHITPAGLQYPDYAWNLAAKAKASGADV